MAEPQVFVSHSHEDDEFCRGIVSSLRGAGADVWYDEHDMGSGRLGPTIERELRRRPVFIVVLSPASLRSQWVEDETRWAYKLWRRDDTRVILPITAITLEEDDIWLFLQDFKRIESPGMTPYPLTEACGRLLHALGLTAPDEALVTPVYQPSESVDDLLAHGKVLLAQDKYTEAIPFLESATMHDPRSVEAWANLGLAYTDAHRAADGVVAFDHALALDDMQAWIWRNKGIALTNLERSNDAREAHRRAEALDLFDPIYLRNTVRMFFVRRGNSKVLAPHARDSNNSVASIDTGTALFGVHPVEATLVNCDRVLALDPSSTPAWIIKGTALTYMQRYEEAIAAHDRALTLSPEDPLAWEHKGYALHGLQCHKEAQKSFEYAERLYLEQRWTARVNWYDKGEEFNNFKRFNVALAAFDYALSLDPKSARCWVGKGKAFVGLRREEDALKVFDHALSLDPKCAEAWYTKGTTLSSLERYEEALVALHGALVLDSRNIAAWNAKASALRHLGRTTEAEEADLRTQALVCNEKGERLSELGRYEEALEAFDQALALDPNDTLAWCNKADALCSLKRYEDALAAYAGALSHKPQDVKAWQGKASVLRALGRTVEADQAEQRARKLGRREADNDQSKEDDAGAE